MRVSNVAPNNNLFRKNALKNIRVEDDIQRGLKIVQFQSWVWLIALLPLFLGLIVWIILGTVELRIQAKGMIVSAEQLLHSDDFLKNKLNEHTKKVYALKKLLESKNILFNHHFITLSELHSAKEEYLAAEELLSAEIKSSQASTDKNKFTTHLYMIAFVNSLDGKKVFPGMNVYVLPNTISSYQYGYIKGRVFSVSQYPETKDYIYTYLGNSNLVDEFFTQGAPYMIKIKLEESAMTFSGLTWTTKNGAPLKIDPGVLSSANIIIKECSPWRLLLR